MSQCLSVMVVDDDPHVREALRDLLESAGYQVMLASDGLSALEQLERGSDPCVILLDWTMPRLGGAGFLAARSCSLNLARIPVFIVSALESSTDPRAQGVFQKPLQVDELLDALGAVCEAHCLRRQCLREEKPALLHPLS